MKLCFLFLLCTLTASASGLKVLFLGPLNVKSHFLYLQYFVRELVSRGHDVTFLTSNTLSHLKLDNYTEILIHPPLELTKVVTQEVLYNQANDDPFSEILKLATFPAMSVEYALENVNVQKFIHNDNSIFDIIINEEFFHDAFLMFGQKYKAPIVTICPLEALDFLDRQNGLLTPFSHIPHWTLSYTDSMSFSQRWYNTMFSLFDWVLRRFIHLPSQEKLAQKYFGHLGPLPSLDDLHRNVSITFTNNHRSLSLPRPSMPNIIRIGGAHLKSVKPLPVDIKKFLDEAEHGVIYFSLGTIMQSSQMPKDKLNAFLNIIKKVKQRVLWKYEDESQTNLPPNVMVRKWLPQNDILAHPNVILFMAHGGLFGSMESISHGVPLLIIPFFGDQYRNGKNAENAGYAKMLPFNQVTNESLSNLVREMITNKVYSETAKDISAKLKDNIVNPMDEFMWWIEHVVKFKGAKYLKSNAVNMSLVSYLLLDVFAVTTFGILVILYAFYFVLKKVFCTKKSVSRIAKKKRN